MRFPGIESTQLEFKRELPQHDQIVKTVIGFSNRDGGRLIIGVEDNGSIIGVPENNIEVLLQSIEQSIYDSCYPTIIPRVATQRFENKTVVVIEVSAGMNKPYHRKIEGVEKGTYLRLAKQTVRAMPEMILELEWQSRGLTFESMAVYQASLDDVDQTAIKKFLNERKNQAKTQVTEELLKAYRVLTYEHTKKYPSTLAILLFGRNPQLYFTEAMIICSHFKGIKGRNAIASVDCVGSLFNQFSQAYEFILSRLNYSFSITGEKREERLEIPEVAIREVLLNAIVHRNYHIKAPTKIAIYNDRIEVFSPGEFVGPLDTNNLRQGISYLRNPMICKIMREANYFEKLGSGFISLFDSYEEYGLQEPQVIEGENYIKCILPRGESKATKLKDINALFWQKEEITIGDVTQYLKVSRSTALRKLNELVKEKKIERVGETKSVRYRKL